jgi:hypothetical protein
MVPSCYNPLGLGVYVYLCYLSYITLLKLGKRGGPFPRKAGRQWPCSSTRRLGVFMARRIGNMFAEPWLGEELLLEKTRR